MPNDSLSPLAWKLSALARDHARNARLAVWICPDLRHYRQLAEELSFFLQDKPEILWRFPAWEVLPYDRVSPHHSIVGERFTTLGRLLQTVRPAGLLLTSLPAWLQRIAPEKIVSRHVWQMHVGQSLDIAALKQRLSETGMVATDRVLSPGEFAARGGLFDVWPATEKTPLRIDMFGDEIESIRRFDPETQRSGASLQHFTSVPVREIILDTEGRETFAAAFVERFPHLRKHPMLEAVRAGRPHPGIESLLPLAFGETARLKDYLPEHSIIYAPEDIEDRRLAFARQVRDQFELFRAGPDPVISPQELYAVETRIGAQPLDSNETIHPAPSLQDFQHTSQPLHALHKHIRTLMDEGWHFLLIGHGPGQQERMLEALELTDVPHCQGLHDRPDAPLATAVGFLESGFTLADDKLIVLTGRELLGQRLPRRRGKGSATLRGDVFASMRELHIGDVIVHEDHGIGRYQGIESIEDHGIHADFLKIAYAGGATIYVPVDELDRLHRYTGEAEPKLDRLGSEKWKRTRERVRRDLLSMAHELVAIEARRSSSQREPIRLRGKLREAYEEFAARFPFEETDDQAAAIDQVLQDLAMPHPMDRVICGDVGFGKTEVAMRAAFAVAASGRQVAILVPTTVLANQHYSSFRERFAGMGMTIGILSRQQGKKDSERIIRELAKGKIRIIVGTHRLLGDQIHFADLGLVIVDEEQRFGVKHKQKLKALHASVDLLTLTATPIPRTLNQALSGLRAVSVIHTPPAEREAIRTVVATFDPHLANEAIRRELYRGGQVYYLHNHVKSIQRIAERLRRDVPEANIGIAHGQMGARELDHQMMAFYEGRLNILLCSTIVESGLDVPNANTLIVERADLLGLAQLHQIRGRVGRSHRQAFAYFFTPDPRAMTPDARERLQAIAEHSALGSGFLIARQDMEIRGAGNLLGLEQSGKIEAIGLDLYMQMLSEAIAEVRGDTELLPKRPVDLDLGIPALLPQDYIPQMGERLSLYRRISRVRDDAAVHLLFEEITDRFGHMPEESRNALELARLRWRAQRLNMASIRMTPQGLRLAFTPESPIDPERMLQHIHREPARFRLTPDGNLTLMGRDAPARQQLEGCIAFLDDLIKDAQGENR